MKSLQLSALATAGILAIALTGCASGGEASSSSTQSDDTIENSESDSTEQLRIAFVPGIASDPFFKAMEIEAKATAEELNVDLLWQGASDEYSPEAQIPFVDAALADDIDGLILVPTDADALQPAVDRAAEMGIPVVTVDTTVNNRETLISHITGDNRDGGQKAAEEMDTQTGGSGKVLIISASPTNTTGTQRVEGFLETLEGEYPGLEALDVQYAYSQPSEATTILSTTLLEHPDLAGVFAVDGTSCTGAVAALYGVAEDQTPALICYDAYSTQVEELENGSVSALVAQQPAEEARLALEFLVAELRGDDSVAIESEVVIPNQIMNRDNLSITRQYQYAE